MSNCPRHIHTPKSHKLARLTNDLSKSIDIKTHKLARIMKKFKWMEIKPVYLDKLRFENVKNGRSMKTRHIR